MAVNNSTKRGDLAGSHALPPIGQARDSRLSRLLSAYSPSSITRISLLSEVLMELQPRRDLVLIFHRMAQAVEM